MRKKKNNEQGTSIDNFNSDTWNNLSLSERLNNYQNLENELAKESGRSARQVEIDKRLSTGNCGYYSFDEPNKIYINKDYLKSNEPGKQYDGMNTIIHEGRHAYQDDCIKGRILHNEHPNTVSLWNRNQEVYNNFANDSASFVRYRHQPLESDANDFTHSKMSSYVTTFSSDDNFKSYLNEMSFKNYRDNELAKNTLGFDFKQNIADEINDYYDYKHKTGNYAAPSNGEPMKHTDPSTYASPVTATDTSKTSPIPNEDKPKGAVDTDKNNNFYDAKVPSNKDKDTDPLASNLDKQNNGMKI